MSVLGACDGGEGVELLTSERFDVVVLDIMMPQVDGWMALMDIRSNPATAKIPVIMLTAKTQDQAKILAFKQGAQQYVTKPFNIAELSARIESLARGIGGLAIAGPSADRRRVPQARGPQGRSYRAARSSATSCCCRRATSRPTRTPTRISTSST